MRPTAAPRCSELRDRCADFAAGGAPGLLGHDALEASPLVVALGIWLPKARRLTLVLAIVAAAFFGVVGQNLGAIFSNGFTGVLESGATDPGSGPLLVLIALALWPCVARSPTVSPASLDGVVTSATKVRSQITRVVDLSPNFASNEVPPEASNDGHSPSESRPARLVSA